jgi:outer membrane protein OmpA-like peptidoglycan-associated protein
MLYPPAETSFKRIADVIKDFPSGHVTIEAHTDKLGEEKTNRALSMERALAVRKVFEKAGLRSEQISAIGLGSSRPLNNSDSIGGLALNRRIELLIYEDRY